MSDDEIYRSDFDAAADLATDAVAVENRVMHLEHPSGGPHVPIAVERTGDSARIVVLDAVIKEFERTATQPARRRGVLALTDRESFIAHVNRYKASETVTYADVEAFTFTTVYNEHPMSAMGNVAGWRDFRATYACPRSPEWLAWTERDGKAMKQEAFADFIEARLEDLTSGGVDEINRYPSPVALLQMARDLTVRVKGEFTRQINPTNGNGVLVNKTENDTGSTEIPRAFLIAVPIFEGGDHYKLEARIRFQLSQGGAEFTYTLHRRKEAERSAFAESAIAIETATERPMYNGRAG